MQFLKKSTEGLKKYHIFCVFWAFLGVIFTQPHCFHVFRDIFWSVDIMGGEHGSIFIFVLFQFLPFLGHFCNFGLFLHFWVVLGKPVTYMITRGIELVVRRATEGVWRVWGGLKGVKRGLL